MRIMLATFGAGHATAAILLQAVLSGLASGAVIALASVGFTVQYGISNVLNFGYGSFMTLAAFFGYLLIEWGISVWAGMAITAAAIAVLSVLLNRGLLAPLLRRAGSWIVVAIGTVYVAMIVQFTIAAVSGPLARGYGRQWGSTIRIGGASLTTAQLVTFALTVVLMLAFHLLLMQTKLGRAMRATAGNRNLARACGIATDRITDITWFITGAMCGAAGVALAMTTVTFDSNLGLTFLVYVIAAAAIGGFGQPYGAMGAALIVGVVSQLEAAYFNPALQDAVAFGLLIVIILTRPQGLFAARSSAR